MNKSTMKKTYLLPVFVLSASCLLAGRKKHEEIDLSGIHTSVADTTMETMSPSVEVSTEGPGEAESTKEDSSDKTPSKGTSISTDIKTWTDDTKGDISIQYPEIAGMNDEKKQKAVNELILANATAIADYWTKDESAADMDIACEVISADRGRLTAVYKGSCKTEDSAYPVKVFYTNTIDLDQVKSLGFNDYADAYTMAGYVMSDDIQFYRISDDIRQEILNYRAEKSIEEYTELFNQADFPLAAQSEDSIFPESFSYTNQGVLYFSIPLPHALGDYAIVTFNIDGK